MKRWLSISAMLIGALAVSGCFQTSEFDTDEFEKRDRLLAEADGSLPNIPHLGWDISKYGKYGLTLGGDLGGNVVCLDRAAAQTMLSKYVIDYGPQQAAKFSEGLEKTKCQQFNEKIEINMICVILLIVYKIFLLVS
jgi:hypothetical protein